MPAAIAWRKEFETGFPEVDKEHAELVGVINGAVAKLGSNPPKDVVRAVLEEIQDMISAHFTHEEQIMEARGYDQYEEHKADHEFLLDEIGALINSLEAESQFIQSEALVRCVSSWFTEHCRTKDVRLHRMLG